MMFPLEQTGNNHSPTPTLTLNVGSYLEQGFMEKFCSRKSEMIENQRTNFGDLSFCSKNP